MEIDNLWKAEAWNPQELMELYVDAGGVSKKHEPLSRQKWKTYWH
jgi:hypothetical protein